MGVYELHPLSSPGMHWQQDRQQMLATAYDPSRDLSPNLPCQESSNSSGCSSGSSSSGGSSTCCKSEFTSCGDCGSPPGAGSGGGGGIGSSIVVGDVKPPIKPCLADHHEPVVCAGCNLRITDRFYLFAVDRRWHASCLQCSQCRLPLDREVTCFARDGSIFCKKDYYRLFGMKRCARCQAAILSSELVMRARELVFHVHCFSCAVCSLLLTKGDTFGMRDGAVFCRVHYSELPPLSPYHSHLHHHPPPPPLPTAGGGPPSQIPQLPPSSSSSQIPPSSHPPSSHTPQSQIPLPPDAGGPPHFNPHQPEFHPRLGPGPPTSQLPPSTISTDSVKMANSFFNGTPAPRQKGRPRKRKPKDLEGMTANLDLNESYLDVAFGPGTPGLGGANGSHHQRTKRMRTSFKHHQLRTMKSYFAINHNPDAKDLKQLSQKTGLPKRVLQVWFQNARAKWRRMVLKQEGGGGGGKDKEPGSGLESYHHSMGQHGSPQHYLSPSPLECSN